MSTAKTRRNKNKALVLEPSNPVHRATTTRLNSIGRPTIFSTARTSHGRDGLFNLIGSAPTPCVTSISSSRGRRLRHRPCRSRPWPARAGCRGCRQIEDGRLANIGTFCRRGDKSQSKSGLPMFGDRFPLRCWSHSSRMNPDWRDQTEIKRHKI